MAKRREFDADAEDRVAVETQLKPLTQAETSATVSKPELPEKGVTNQ